MTILVVFFIGFIMFVIIRDQIIESKAIVGRNKIDAGGGIAVITFVEIGAACKPFGKFSEAVIGAAPVIAHDIAVLAIPFCPAGWKLTNLISSFPYIPGF